MNLAKVTTILFVVLIGCLTAQTVQAQTFTSLHSFAGTSAGEGAFPMYGPLAQGLDGNLYGTTMQGGLTCSGAYCGTVFQVSGGSVSTIYKFCPLAGCADGNAPEGGLALNSDGTLYGMTDLGGSVDGGTLFKVTTGGALKTLNNFTGPNGGFPLTTLIRSNKGMFYGITNSGGSLGDGVIFKATAAGVIKVLVNLNSATTGIAQGNTGALTEGTDKNFYGTVALGGSGTDGTVFKMKPSGAIKVLHNFSGPDGLEPNGLLAQGTDGNFYGTTVEGGSTGRGTVFKITPGGAFTTIYTFCTVNGCPDGFSPFGGLLLATDGNFYGTTSGGGNSNNPQGTVYRITPAGSLTTLHSFNGLDGARPYAPVIQHTDGLLYGTTTGGGANDLGTVYSLDVGLGPFVRAMPWRGAAGTKVIILGGNLTGSTAVSFNGTAAAFLVVSDTEITTKVPAGATTGYITVTTPGAMLQSNVPFHVP